MLPSDPMGLVVTVTPFVVPSAAIKGTSEFSRLCRMACCFYRLLKDVDQSLKVKLVGVNRLSVELIVESSDIKHIYAT